MQEKIQEELWRSCLSAEHEGVSLFLKVSHGEE